MERRLRDLAQVKNETFDCKQKFQHAPMAHFQMPRTQLKTWTNFSWQDKPWAEFSTLEVAACHAMHLLRSIAIWRNLELNTRPKRLLGSLPLDIVLPAKNNQILINEFHNIFRAKRKRHLPVQFYRLFFQSTSTSYDLALQFIFRG